MPEFSKHEPGTLCFPELVTSDPAGRGRIRQDFPGQEGLAMKRSVSRDLGLTVSVLVGAIVLITVLSL